MLAGTCTIDFALSVYIFALKSCIISVSTPSNRTKNFSSNRIKEFFWYKVNDAIFEDSYVDLSTEYLTLHETV